MGRSGKLRGGAAVVVSAAAVVLGSGCGVFEGQSSQETVVIAADLELTGSAHTLGTVYRDALQLRVDQVNAQGLLGDRRLELIIRDNRSDPAISRVNVQELAGDPSVTAIIIGQCGECVVESAEVIESLQVPTISLAHTDDVVNPIEERHYIFKLGPNADHNAAELAREIARSGASTVGVVASADSYGKLGAEAMSNAAARAGLDVVASVTVEAGDSSIRSAYSKLAEYRPEPEFSFGVPVDDSDPGPDAVVLWVPPEDRC